MNIVTLIFRLLVGLLFIISGLIKANDPLGFSYKLTEYFEVFGTTFFIPLSLFLAIVICIVEVVLGAALLLGARINLVLWLLLLTIIFFTGLTFYSAYYNKVTDCGCFGDALKGLFGRSLTPWESFGKDVTLLVFIIMLFVGKDYINPVLPEGVEKALMILVLIGAIVFPVYTYNNLPVIDFRPYAIGNNIPQLALGTPDSLKWMYTLKDKKTGATIDVEKWPKDWDKKYTYVKYETKVVKKGVEPKIKDFSISTFEGVNVTQDILKNKDYNFLLICYDLHKTDKDAFGPLNDFSTLCKQNNIRLVALTASSKSDVDALKSEVNTTIDFYNTDGTVLKTMIRSNPGLMMLKDGVVIAMWHYHNLPSFSEINENYLKK